MRGEMRGEVKRWLARAGVTLEVKHAWRNERRNLDGQFDKPNDSLYPRLGALRVRCLQGLADSTADTREGAGWRSQGSQGRDEGSQDVGEGHDDSNQAPRTT
jgi:hypothetical protein